MSRKKKEQKFLTELGHSFADIGYYAYKIPDIPFAKGLRFNPSKPFDMLVVGLDLQIEAKSISKWEAFGMRHLRPSQIEGLNASEASQGNPYVFLNVRITASKSEGIKRENRLYIFGWSSFKKLKTSIKAKDLKEINYIEGHKNRFDLSGLFSA